jgi:hypothetical protein
MKQKIALKAKKNLENKLNKIGNADENKNITAAILPLSDAEIQGLLHPAHANLGYFLV